MPSEDDLKALFTYQPPTKAQEAQYHELFTPARILAQTFAKHCTPSAALDFAIHQIYAACWIAVGVVAAAPSEEIEETVLVPQPEPGQGVPMSSAEFDAAVAYLPDIEGEPPPPVPEPAAEPAQQEPQQEGQQE